MKIPKRIGFIGLGIMGQPMAKNLIKNNYRIKVYNRTREKAYELEKLGAEICSTPKELAQLSNVIITMLENEKAMDNVLKGPAGVFEGISSGSYLINMSTVSKKYTEYLKDECFKKGVYFVDSPVSGSKPLAENKTLVILTACEKEVYEYIKDILLSMGKHIVYCGLPPKATVLKLAINLIVAHLTTAIVESVFLAEKSGIDPALIFETLENSPALNCGYFSIKKQKLLNKDFSPQFSLKNMLKDINFMIELAQESKIHIPITETIKELFDRSFKDGLYNEDLTAIMKTIDSISEKS